MNGPIDCSNQLAPRVIETQNVLFPRLSPRESSLSPPNGAYGRRAEMLILVLALETG